MRFPRPCLKCQQLHRDQGDYCNSCRTQSERERERQRSQDPVRQAKKKILYSSAYRNAREILKANATHCHLCKEPFTDRSEISADHLVPGDPASPLLPAHKRCNYARGNRPLNS
jgi:hypothetical protein